VVSLTTTLFRYTAAVDLLVKIGSAPKIPAAVIESKSWVVHFHQKSSYLGNGMTHYHKICHSYAYWSSQPCWPLKLRILKIQHGVHPSVICKNLKIVISVQCFKGSHRNLAGWCSGRLWTQLLLVSCTPVNTGRVHWCSVHTNIVHRLCGPWTRVHGPSSRVVWSGARVDGHTKFKHLSRVKWTFEIIT